MEHALSDFSKAIDLDDKAALSFNARGLLRDKMGKPAVALDDFNAACALDSGNESFLRNRALCNRACGNMQDAIRDFTTLLRVRRMHARCRQGQV